MTQESSHWLLLEKWSAKFSKDTLICPTAARFSSKVQVWYLTVCHQLRCA